MKIKLEIDLTNRAVKQYKKLKKEHQKEILSVIDDLLDDIVKNAEINENNFQTGEEYFEKGKGQPEKLKGDLMGYWSRRIDKKNRLVYKINLKEKTIEIVSFYGHYDDK